MLIWVTRMRVCVSLIEEGISKVHFRYATKSEGYVNLGLGIMLAAILCLTHFWKSILENYLKDREVIIYYD